MLLIKNGTIITMDSSKKIIENGGVAIDGNRILDIGTTKELETKYLPDEVIDAKNMAVLPGLINLHTHLSEKLIPGIVDELPLYEWLDRLVYPTAMNTTREECYWSAMLGIVEMVKSGTTCFADMFSQLTERYVLDKVAEAVIKTGIRGNLSREIEEIEENSAEIAIHDTIRAIKNYHGKGDGRVRIRFGPGILISLSEDRVREVRELATKYSVGIQIHLSETLNEVEDIKKEHGKRPIEYAHEIGLLGYDVIGAHCNWVMEKEINILNETKTKVAHNPVSNMKLATGVAPVPEMLEKSVVVGLGTDGNASNDNLDMFSCMKFAACLQKIHHLNPRLMPSDLVLEMATVNGAKALLLENEIGSIEVGKKADLTLIDLRQPNMIPVHNIVKQMVYSAHGGNVDTVIVNGRIIMRNRKILTVNENLVMDKAQEAAKDLAERIGVIKYR